MTSEKNLRPIKKLEPSQKHRENDKRPKEEEIYREINIVSFRKSLRSLTGHYKVSSELISEGTEAS